MPKQQKAKHSVQRSRRDTILDRLRIMLFIVTLLAVIITGVLIIRIGSNSLATQSSAVFTMIIGVVAVIQIYPVLITHAPTAPPNSPSLPPPQTPNVNTGQLVFLISLPLQDSKEFYGRMAARMTLITRVSKGGSSSIVGDRRMGKTWLLKYLQLIAPTDPTLGPFYRIGYVSASHPNSKSVANFIQQALEKLNVSTHTIDLNQSPLSQLSQGVRDLKKQGIFPVLCIDEFEGFDNKQEFNTTFIEGLRALAQDDGLVLVIASKRSLRELIEDLTGQTSPLFNIMERIQLYPFIKEEALAFVCDKSDKAGFNKEERDNFLDLSVRYDKDGKQNWPPLRLQLAGKMLLDDKNAQAISADTPANDQKKFKDRLEEEYQEIVRHT